MNSPILPVKGHPDMSRAASSALDDIPDVSALVTELAAREEAFAPLASRGLPPARVLDQIAAAGTIHDHLCEGGHQLRFFAGAPGERTRIELHDSEGNAVRTLSPGEAFELAAGRSLE